MIKLIALITMVIDHIGLVFYPEVAVFRVIGRISMPLFAFCIAKGFFYSQKNNTVIKYMKNLLTLAITSQIPYSFINSGMNIVTTWLIAVIVLAIQEVYKDNFIKKIIMITLFLILSILLNVDYNICGVLLPFIYYNFWIKKERKGILCLFFILLNIYYIIAKDGWLIQIFSCLSLPILFNFEKYEKIIKLPKKFYYIFYPTHLIAFLVIKVLI